MENWITLAPRYSDFSIGLSVIQVSETNITVLWPFQCIVVWQYCASDFSQNFLIPPSS